MGKIPKIRAGIHRGLHFILLFIPASTIKQVSGILNALRTIWFSLAFVAAQVFNILWTLLWAYLLFDGRFFPIPNLK